MQQSLEKRWFEIIRRKSERDGWVEVSAALAEDENGPAPSYRARVLWVEAEGRMGVERPPFVGVNRQLRVERPVQIRLTEDGVRLRADSRIAEVRHHQLNAHTKLIALALDRPSGIQSDQRREFYRVSVQGVELEPIEFSPVRDETMEQLATEKQLGDEDVDAAATLNCRPVKGTLVNISGGGLGVSVPATRELLDTLPPSRCYTATLPLPDGETPLELTLRLVHVQMHQAGRVYFGMRAEEPNAGIRAEIEERLVRFTTKVERRQLRRQRSA
jgi:c-di-GMP-binding flagellar brake protein YcgR